ncbi:hypothetical protein pdam_00009321 [Pocillopora damicornis]|uniref:protein-serine/threonine phosphatase n=1 Tax=Pocillopora damicornis TaxID=46731 RepID=A0A3M6UM00_POCDA|nr:hypothetical protein pdam_00009321 [Pocillopora damicornis]
MTDLCKKFGLDVDTAINQLLDYRNSSTKLVQLPEGTIRLICQVSREVFMQEGVLLELGAPMNIFGDIHGQYEDLLRHFDNLGYPPDIACLFMGDYVDRIYGFYDECKRRYNIKLWKTFTDCFNCLPIAAVVESTIFCSHGGLSPDLHDFDQLRSLERPMDVPDDGLVCDLLWSDPDEDITGWGDNDRGVSWTFGGDVVRSFLEKHDLSLVARAHQLVTLFSAPNYCGEFDNAGGVLVVHKNLMCSLSILKPNSVTNKIKDTLSQKKSGRLNRSSNRIQVQ